MAAMVLVVIVVSLLCGCNGVGFNYPNTMPDCISAQNALLMTTIPFIREYETPIQIRFTSIIDETMWNCLATYHLTALDSLTKQRPRIPADSDTINNYGNSQTRMLCSLYASFIVTDFIVPEANNAAKQLITQFGLDPAFITLSADVAGCDINDTVCLQNVASTKNYIPETMASIVAYQVIDYLKNDGWNQDGSIGSDGEECSANCRPYSDTTGYKPVEIKSNKNKNKNMERWQPLVEDNGKGFFYHYDHVVPHIGYTAKTKVLSRDVLESKSAPDPQYDYDVEVELVIQRLAELATNDTQKMLVEFFDDKISLTISQLFQLDALLQWTWEQRTLFLVGESAAIYDALIQSWREKIIWDLVRPTTLIKRRENEEITTYGGPNKDVQTIKAKDFESYIRTMPHSEYPSGSGCICRASAEFTDKLLSDYFGIVGSTSITLPVPGGFFLAESSKIEPNNTPSNNLFVTINDLTELWQICGESRLWGGMHFTASVDGAYQICEGLGEAAYDFAVGLLNGAPL